MSENKTMDKDENLEDEDASKYIYVSTRHYKRKLQVEKDVNSHLTGSITKPGPIGAFMIYIFDIVIEFMARFIISVFSFVETGFNFIMAYTFGNFSGLFPNVDKYGTLISYRFFRYIVNILLPPIGVFLAKGLYGWFNIFICFIITYVHYVAGIIYCFVITSHNRYADLYEKTEYEKIAKINENYKNKGKGDIFALLIIVGLIVIFIGLIIAFLKYV